MMYREDVPMMMYFSSNLDSSRNNGDWLSYHRIGAIAAIIALHVGLWFVVQSGMMRTIVRPLSPPVFFSIIMAARLPPPPAPPPPKLKPLLNPVRPVLLAPPPSIDIIPEVAPVIAPVSSDAPVAHPVAAAPPQPIAAPAPIAAIKTISSGVEYLQAPQPEYPLLAKRMGEHGKVILRVLVNEKGRAEQAEVQHSSGSARLDQAARTAVLRALFKPHVEDGQPVAVIAIVPILFELA